MMRVNDLVEDREGDKAVVREVYEDGYVGIVWDCNPGGPIRRTHESRLTNLSERVRELEHEGEEQCAYCGEWRGPDSFEDGLRCKFCAEAEDENGPIIDPHDPNLRTG